MKYLYISCLLIIYQISFAFELKCSFEEVYQNGEVQQGFFLIKDDKFRYEYFSDNLYTVIHNQNLFFLIENKDKTKFVKISRNKEILEAIFNIISDYPNFNKDYYFENVKIKLEFNNKNFIKRIILLSEENNLSVYLNDCKTSQIKNLFFSYSPFFEYKH